MPNLFSSHIIEYEIAAMLTPGTIKIDTCWPYRITIKGSKEEVVRPSPLYVKGMPYSEEHVKNKLQRELEAVYLNVEDFSDGCGSKFQVLVVSPQFVGKSLLERQRMVNSVLQEEMKSIHALTQKTYTPEQWEKINQTTPD